MIPKHLWITLENNEIIVSNFPGHSVRWKAFIILYGNFVHASLVVHIFFENVYVEIVSR